MLGFILKTALQAGRCSFVFSLDTTHSRVRVRGQLKNLFSTCSEVPALVVQCRSRCGV